MKRKCAVQRKYTDAEKKFLLEFVPGHSHEETLREFNRRFPNDIELTLGRLKNLSHRLGVNNGTNTGQFKNGNIPRNKGKKYTEEQRARLSEIFKAKSDDKAGRMPIGCERVLGRYIYIKTAQPDIWEAKHRVIWRQANEEDIGDDEIIIFLNGNNRDFRAENLYKVKRCEGVCLFINHLISSEPDITLTNIARVKLKLAVKDAENKLED